MNINTVFTLLTLKDEKLIVGRVMKRIKSLFYTITMLAALFSANLFAETTYIYNEEPHWKFGQHTGPVDIEIPLHYDHTANNPFVTSHRVTVTEATGYSEATWGVGAIWGAEYEDREAIGTVLYDSDSDGVQTLLTVTRDNGQYYWLVKDVQCNAANDCWEEETLYWASVFYNHQTVIDYWSGSESHEYVYDIGQSIDIEVKIGTHDHVGPAESAEFYHNGNTYQGIHQSNPSYYRDYFYFNWQPTPAETGTLQTISAKATDEYGRESDISSRTYHVNYRPRVDTFIATKGPQISIGDGDFDVFVETTDIDGEVDEVTICYQVHDPVLQPKNCSVITESVITGPNKQKFTRTLSPADIGIGDHTHITFTDVKDNMGAESTTYFPTMTISVNDYDPPIAWINSLNSYDLAYITNNVVEYNEGQSININAIAHDTDGGNIVKVEFRVDGSPIACYATGTASCSAGLGAITPGASDTYSYTFSNPTPSTAIQYLTVYAIDNDGLSYTLSQAVQFRVNPFLAPEIPSFIGFNPNETINYSGTYWVEWGAKGTEFYVIERCINCTDNTGWKLRETTGNGESTFEEPDLPSGEYKYRVKACHYNPFSGDPNPLCSSWRTSVAITVDRRGVPVFPDPFNYTFEATPVKNDGNFTLNWELLPGTIVEDDSFLLHKKAGDYQCATPEDPTACEAAWQNVPLTSDMALTHQETNHPEGVYSYRLTACNVLDECTAGPMLQVEVLAPVITELSSGCNGGCINIKGLYIAPDATVDIGSLNDDLTTQRINSSDLAWVDGVLQASFGISTPLNQFLEDYGIKVTVTNPNGTASSMALESKQQSSIIALSDTTPAMSHDGQYIYTTVGGKLHAIDITNGEEVVGTQWPFNVPNETLSSPVVDTQDGTVYVGSTDDRLYSVNTMGVMKWAHETLGDVLSPPILGEAGIVYFGSMDSSLYAVNPETGNRAWMRNVYGSGIKDTPILSGNNNIYFSTVDGYVYSVNRRLLGPNVLVWESQDDSLLNYYIRKEGWLPGIDEKDEYYPVARLFRAILQPQMQPNREVLAFWTYASIKGAELNEVASAFLNSDIGAVNYPASDTNAQFVTQLYIRLFNESMGFSPVVYEGTPYSYTELVAMLDDGSAQRADIAVMMAGSADYIAAANLNLGIQFDYLYEESFTYEVACSLQPAACDLDDLNGDGIPDGDGLPDWWEIMYFGSIDIYDFSFEINGMSLGVAYATGSNPCEGDDTILCQYAEDSPVVEEALPPNDTLIAESDKVGFTPAKFRVDESGAATYTVPIFAAPGVAGVTPQVSLTYSSNQGNGLVGRGWAISGISTISRCRQTKATEGESLPVTFTDSDRFCLDGQKLIADDPANYHQNGSTYKTEIDSFAVITYYSSGDGYFTVERKDGSVSTYGATDESRLGNTGKIISWAQTQFSDSAGNAINFEYRNDGYGQRIGEIFYAYGESATAGAAIIFNYEYSRLDPIHAYVAGDKISTTARLVSIDSVPDSDAVNANTRHYALEYRYQDPANIVSKLASIQESVGNIKLPKQRFGWTQPQLSYEPTIKRGFANTKSGSKGIYAFKHGDINGDGRADLLHIEYKTHSDDPTNIDQRFRYSLAQSDGTLSDPQPFIKADGSESCCFVKYNDDTSKDEKVLMEVIDYNADGRTDAIVYNTRSNMWKVYLSTLQSDGRWMLPYKPIETGVMGEHAQFLDIDGDGLVDAVYEEAGEIKVKRMIKDPLEPLSSNHYYKFAEVGEPLATTADLNLLRPNLPVGFEDRTTYELSLVPGGTQDFNGDGRVDIVVEERTEACSEHSDYTGNVYYTCKYAYSYGFYARGVDGALEKHESPLSPADSDSFIWYDGISQEYCADEFTCNSYTKEPEERPLALANGDINADGLTDLFYTLNHNNDNNEENWRYALSTGTGFANDTEFGNLRDYNFPQLVDFNQDGYLDAIWVDKQTSARIWNPVSESFEPEQVIASQSNYLKKSPVLHMDVNGDARLDIVYVNTRDDYIKISHASPFAGDVWINDQLYQAAEDQHGTAHMITSFDNGFGNRTTVEYESLSRTDHYARLDTGVGSDQGPFATFCDASDFSMPDTDAFYTALNSGLVYSVNEPGISIDAPVLELMMPMYVVTTASSTAPAAKVGETQLDNQPGQVDNTAVSTVDYYYREAKIQAAGRGMLGFRQLTTVDQQTRIQVSTEYRQDFPFAGLPRKTEKYTPDCQLFSSATNYYGIQGWDGVSAPPEAPYQSYVKESIETSFDPLTEVPLSTVTAEVLDVDGWGNVIEMQTSTLDEVSGEMSFQHNLNIFDTDSEAARFGRLLDSTVTHTRGADTITRHSSFSYYQSGPQKWLLATETVEPGTNFEVKTTYNYDEYGNKISVFTEGNIGKDDAAGTQIRSESWSYDGRGRYLEKTYNSDGVVVQEVISRNALGQITEAQDVNGGWSKARYGVFGSKVFETNSTGSYAQTLSYMGGGSYCDYPTQYHVVSEAAGGGKGFACFDRIGREIKTGKLGFNGHDWYITKTEYDSSNRVVHKTVPHVEGEEPHWLVQHYDDLGRSIGTTVSPYDASKTTTVAYDGFKTTVTNRKSQTKEETINAFGELVHVRDNMGGTIDYTYDPVGNLLTTTTSGNDFANGAPTSIVVAMGYDEKGLHKISMNDPDKGYWRYFHNAFGELVEQIDARGRKTVMSYDKYGRMISRNDYLSVNELQSESTTTWVYDSAQRFNSSGVPVGYAIGLLDHVVQTSNYSGDGATYAGDYRKDVIYDAQGRVTQTTTTLEGGTQVYTESVTYDEYGREFQVFDASGHNRGTQNIYNDYGYLSQVREAMLVNGEQLVYKTILAMDARGNITEELLNNGLTTYRDYDPVDGFLTRIHTTLAGVYTAQDQTYDYDQLGNLEYKDDQHRGMIEYHCYDDLNRLTGSAIDTACSQTDIQYDSYGNIMQKQDVGTYSYGGAAMGAGPHAVSSAGGIDYYYDANGNMMLDKESGSDRRKLAYTQFDKPFEVIKGSHKTTFLYGPGRDRYKRVDTGTTGTTTTYYLGNVEIINRDGVLEVKRYVAGNVLVTENSLDERQWDSWRQEYMLLDHLGSVDAIVGQVITDTTSEQQFSFDAWGKRRNPANPDLDLTPSEILTLVVSTTSRGYTGHEMLDEIGLIHMNGRVYDPVLGRFMSADPFIQSPGNTQSFNRYSYVFNNPLAYTDPSGYFGRSARADFGRALTVIGAAIVKAGASAANPYVVAIGAIICVIGGAITGRAEGDTAMGIAMGAFTAAAAYGSYYMQTYQGIEAAMAFSAVTGGVMAEVSGGNFWHGFAVAGVTTYLNMSEYLPTGPVNDVINAVVIGGTMSEATGGKFANGAAYAAFSYAVSAGIRAGVNRSSGQTRFKTQHAAAKHALRHANPLSISEDVEYGGSIYQNEDGTYSYTGPVRGQLDTIDPLAAAPPPEGFNATATYHTHGAYVEGRGYNNENFSDLTYLPDGSLDEYGFSGDIPYADMHAIDSYLGTPSNQFKYYQFNYETQNKPVNLGNLYD